ncbi:MAG: hypothetical protein H0T48_17735 [Gemmatimonadaceae bacterium]|nr:hypothetical protein [Gemmatimonadaceae bacterium]
MTDDDRTDEIVRIDEMIRTAARDYNHAPSVPKDEMWAAIEAARVTAGPRLVVTAPTIAAGASRRANGRHAIAPKFAWWGSAAAAVLLVAAGVGIGRLTSPGASMTRSSSDRAAAESESAVARGAGAESESILATGEAAVAEVPNPGASVSPGSTTAAEASRGAESGAAGSRTTARRAPRVASVTPGARSVGTAPRSDGLAPPDAAQTYQVATIRHLADAEALLTSFAIESRDERVNAQVAGWAKGLLSNTRLLLDSPAGDDPRRARLLEDLELVLAQIVQLSPGAAASERELIQGSIQNGQVMTRLRTAIPAGPTRGL